MQNINELIGIIKGINFDGVINNKEVSYLQLWVDKNRNLIYDNHQMKFIEMLDSVLEDQMIDDDEKILMLRMCDEFSKVTSDDSARIDELNALMEGVICDGEVNEAEIIGLRKQIESYEGKNSNNSFSSELSKVEDWISKNGTLKSREQVELLELLNSKVRKSKFNRKINYLCRMINGKKNIGIELISILDNESIMKEIHNIAENKLMQAVSSYSGDCSDKEIIIISMSLIAILKYDGNFYKNVKDIYQDIYEKYPCKKVENTIRSILIKYKKKSDSCKKDRIINVALENAIVPQLYLSAFYEFVFDIYKWNFEYDIPEEPYEEFKFVFEGLRDNMISDVEDISINVTQKTYKLISATKQLIRSEGGVDVVIKLSIIILNIIDSCFWGREVSISNPYLKVGYDGWKKTLKDSDSINYKCKISNSRRRANWEIKFLLLNNSIYIKPHEHRVKTQYDYRDIEVVILNGEEELYRHNKCDIREIIGGYKINMDEIEITKPLGKLRCRIIAADEIIYDSKDKLYRNYIVFNDDGKEIRNNSDYEGRVYVVYRKEEITLENIVSKVDYSVGDKMVRIGDVINIGNDIFSFSSMEKSGILGQKYLNCNIQQEGKEKLIPVYYGTCFLVFEADNSSSKFEIKINEKPHKLIDMQHKIIEKVGSKKYFVELGIKKSGIYKIDVKQLVAGHKKSILQEDLAYDKGLSYSKGVITDTVNRIWIKSELIPYNINREIALEDFMPEFIKFDYYGIRYNYLLPFDFGFYKLSDGEWRSKSEGIWIDEIYEIYENSRLSLYDSECDEAQLFTETGLLADRDIKLIDKGYYKQLLVNFLVSYKENRYLKLVFTANGRKKHDVTIYNKCVMDEEKTEIILFNNPKKIAITPVFHGKNKVFYELVDSSGEIISDSKLLETGQTSEINDFKSFKEYRIKFYEKTKGFPFENNEIILEERRIFYAMDDFVGRSFKIVTIYFNQKKRGKFDEKHWFLKKYYIKLTELVNIKEGTFKGQIFCKSYEGNYYLNNINPVDVEICGDVIDNTVDIYITNQGDGLLFDLEYKGIMNYMEHATAPDIFLYTISMKGEDYSEKIKSN